MNPCVLHIDIDAFFASVEQLRNPRLKGKPVAVGSGVVASASYEARRFGLRAGMPLREARKRCPGLIVLEGHAPIYRCFSEPVFRLSAEYSPKLETYLDEAYCDLSGMEALCPDPLRLARELKDRIRAEIGLTVTAGIASNRMFAKMASKSAKPDGLRRILPDEEEAFFLGLPVRHLPGVGPKIEKLLEKLNIQTVADLRALSRDSLRRLLGLPGLLLYERCRGKDTVPVSPREVPQSIRRETSFHEDAIDPDIIDGTLYYLTERAASTLRQLRLEARQVGVKIRYGDFDEESATRKLREATQRDSELFAAALEILKSLYTRRVALRLVGVCLSGLHADTGLYQTDLLAGDFSGKAEYLQTSGVLHTDGVLEATGSPDRSRLQTARPVPGIGPFPGIARGRGELRLLESLDAIRQRYGYSSVVCGRSLNLLGKLAQDEHGFVLRTPCLTR